MHRHVVHAPLLVAVERERDAGQLEQLEAALERDRDRLVDRVGLDRREEPDRAVVERVHRHTASRVSPERGQDAAVAAQDEREVGGFVRLGSDTHALLLGDAVLLRLPRRDEHLDLALARESQQPLHALARLLGILVREERDALGLLHGSTCRAAASTDWTAPGRPASASQTNVSSLPAGPGRPDDA